MHGMSSFALGTPKCGPFEKGLVMALRHLARTLNSNFSMKTASKPILYKRVQQSMALTTTTNDPFLCGGIAMTWICTTIDAVSGGL